MAQVNYRTLDIDAYDPEAPQNFDLSTLTPSVQPISTQEIQQNAQQVRQMLRSGDGEGALRSGLESVPYGGNRQGKDTHTQAVIETLQSIRQSDMTPLLTRLYSSPGGPELLDVLMKYLYKGMGASASSAGASKGAAGANMTPQSTGFSQVGGRPAMGDGSGQSMSVLLSWHERVVEVGGPGCILRCMTDRRTV